MIAAVNVAEKSYNNLCVGGSYDEGMTYDALINSKSIKNGNTKLAILVKYGTEGKRQNEELSEESVMMNITIRTTGYLIDKEDYEYNEEEKLTLVPYVLDLKKIREMQTENYHSKVLIYSNSRELEMYYIQSGTPGYLFSGNILMLYTNEDVINEKYNGASTMILLTNPFSKQNQVIIGEHFRFKVSFFNSAKTIQYYVSANPEGRPLNNPTSIEMLSCDQPYYYILNYHQTEEDRKLHIDTIFGEINTTKFADQLNHDSWDSFVSYMTEFKGDEYIIKAQTRYHIDVFEVTCKTPLLLNVYYTDEANPKKSNLQQGDVSILTLEPNAKDSLTFIENLKGSRFLYSFSVQRKYGAPDILIEFENKNENIQVNKNGIYIHNTTDHYSSVIISNKQLSGDDNTKIYFKFGYNIDETFTKIENDIYNIQTEDRTDNIFVYAFKNGEDRLNYTKVNFTVSTTYQNVKFCYSTNLGTFIYPSTQNCFRVGEKNSYTITIINPYIMYKNYYTGEGVMDYFVSFKTENKDFNITILPELIRYNTTNRNFPDIPNTLIINKEEKTILTNPDNKEYLFVQMEICSENSSVTYEFNNGFNGESLGYNGAINSGMKYNYRSISNTKLDTELIIKTSNQDVNMFIRHTGIDNMLYPNVRNININYKDKKLTFSQPIIAEEFKYTILLDKKLNIEKQHYTLCSFSQNKKMAYYTDSVTSSAQEVSYELDFENNSKLKGYEDFEVLILAEEINNGKMMILSDVYSPSEGDGNGGDGNRMALIIVIIALTLVCVLGGIWFYLYLRRLKNRKKVPLMAKPTGMAEIDGTDAGQKLVESMSQSQAAEKQ